MALKDIIVPIDRTEACKGRVDAALYLARAYGAHVTGIAVIYTAACRGRDQRRDHGVA
jgi:hypothetical protein